MILTDEVKLGKDELCKFRILYFSSNYFNGILFAAPEGEMDGDSGRERMVLCQSGGRRTADDGFRVLYCHQLCCVSSYQQTGKQKYEDFLALERHFAVCRAADCI